MKGKIKTIKFYNSVKASNKGVAATQLDYVNTKEALYSFYDIKVDGMFIEILNTQTQELTYSSINNVVYFTLDK